MAFVVRLSFLLAGVVACGSSSSDGGDKGSSGGGGSSAAGGSNSGGSSGSSAGTNNSGGSSGSNHSGGSGGSSSGASGAAGTGTGGGAGTSSGGSGGGNACPPGLPVGRPGCSVPNQMCSYGQSICTCMASPAGLSWQCVDGGGGGSGGNGGSGGSSGGPCGECAEAELCVFQVGGPGTSRFVCANNPPCTLAGQCACVMGQGSCSYQMVTTDAGVVEMCSCDNGLD